MSGWRWMKPKRFIIFILSVILFFYECAILLHISSVSHYLFWHSLTIVILAMNVYWSYRLKEELLYFFLLLVSALMAGPLGIGSFLLMAILRPIFSLSASSNIFWFEVLFPQQNISSFERIIERINSLWDDYDRQGEVTPFQNVFSRGSLFDKQKVLDMITENFDASYAPILKEALKDHQNLIRVQAAAIVAKINTDFEDELKKVEKLHIKFPNNREILLQLAEHMDEFVFTGVLDELRNKEIASLAVRYYRDYLKFEPDNLSVWLGVARLLFYQKDYESFVAWYKNRSNKFGSMPKILHSWKVESLYHLRGVDEFKMELENL